MATISIPKGAIIKIRGEPDFDTFSEEEAKRVLYEQVIPACERKGVRLSQYGNHAGQGSLASVEKYQKLKSSSELFDVKRVQKAFAEVLSMIDRRSEYRTNSYGFKHHVEKVQDEYISNGDCIVAMLLHGFPARFGKRGNKAQVNCEFQIIARPLEENKRI